MKKEFDIHQFDDKLLELLSEVYNQGYNNAREELTHSTKIGNVEYYDLCLPSGTLWSCPVKHFEYGHKLELYSYEEAMQMEIPTIQQFEELRYYCRVVGYNIVGSNCAKIGYENAPIKNPYLVYTAGVGTEKGRNMFWLKSEPNARREAKTIVFDCDIMEFGKHFIGFELPIFLVKNTKDLNYDEE